MGNFFLYTGFNKYRILTPLSSPISAARVTQTNSNPFVNNTGSFDSLDFTRLHHSRTLRGMRVTASTTCAQKQELYLLHTVHNPDLTPVCIGDKFSLQSLAASVIFKHWFYLEWSTSEFLCHTGTYTIHLEWWNDFMYFLCFPILFHVPTIHFHYILIF